MGYRATVITRHREYGSTTFGDWDDFYYNFIPRAEEAGLAIEGNENMDFFEVPREDLQKFTDTLPDDDEQTKFLDGETTNKSLKYGLQLTHSSFDSSIAS